MLWLCGIYGERTILFERLCVGNGMECVTTTALPSANVHKFVFFCGTVNWRVNGNSNAGDLLFLQTRTMSQSI